MPSTKKKKSGFADQEKHTLEFTPAQLIGAICTLMVFGLVCFLLGGVVNKFDSSHAPKRAVAVARPGQTVLLAPACASFDQFRSYAQRGDTFCNLVRRHVAAETP